MTQQMDNTIEAEIQGLAERYDRDGLEGLTRLIAERVNRSQGTGNSLYLLTTYTLEPLVGNLDRWPLEASIDNEKWLELPPERAAIGHPHAADHASMKGGPTDPPNLMGFWP